MSEIMETIMHRRAIRRFDARQVDEAALQDILQAGLYAPSAGGKQGVIFAVCQDREVNERLGKIKRANQNPHMATAGNVSIGESNPIRFLEAELPRYLPKCSLMHKALPAHFACVWRKLCH